MKKGKLASIVAIISSLVSIALSGCGSSSTPTDTKQGDKSVTASTSGEDQALIEAAKKEGKLVVYEGTPEPWLGQYLAEFHNKYPFIDVSEYFRAGGNALYTKLLSEIQAGQNRADVFASASVSDLVDFKNRNLLLEYHSPEEKNVLDGLKDPGYWAAYRINAITMAYNPKVLSDAEAPKTWNDLLDPKYKGKIGFEDSSSGSQFAEWYALRSVLGDEFFEKLAKQEPKIYNSSGLLVQGVLTGELLVAGQTESFRIYQEGTLKGSPIKGVFPSEGIPGMIAPLGILKDAKHPAAAKLYMNWALSKEGQEYRNSIILGGYSSRTDVAPPKGMPDMNTLKILYPKDVADFQKNQTVFSDTWKKLMETKK